MDILGAYPVSWRKFSFEPKNGLVVYLRIWQLLESNPFPENDQFFTNRIIIIGKKPRGMVRSQIKKVRTSQALSLKAKLI